jgi:hypothetical protein
MRVITGLVDICSIWRLAHPDKGSDVDLVVAPALRAYEVFVRAVVRANEGVC